MKLQSLITQETIKIKCLKFEYQIKINFYDKVYNTECYFVKYDFCVEKNSLGLFDRQENKTRQKRKRTLNMVKY